ncbi:MAG: hypothetical protein JW704_13005 [Anaerolineaceae bacterium]|nr:hypothetical protein [Anaerolineaceae bacterium]
MEMVKRVLFTMGYCLLLSMVLIGCAGKPPPPSPMLTVTSTQSHRARTTFTPTYEQLAFTPSPTVTITQTFSSQCPENRYVPIDEFLAAIEPLPTPGPNDIAFRPLYEDEILTLINAFGTGPFIRYIREHGGDHYWWPTAEMVELTGDGTPELIVSWVYMYIYGCRSGQYQLLAKLYPGGYLKAPEIMELRDGNQNNVPEMILSMGTLSQGGGTFGIFEFSGETFKLLVDPDVGYIWHEASGDIRFKDVNGDGAFEVYLYMGIPVWGDSYSMGVPWRKEWDTYEWDGEYYVLNRKEFSPPEYRFQAVYDGDLATLYGEYDHALASYQKAVFDVDLKVYSEAEWQYLRDWGRELHSDALIPTRPSPDRDDYPYLAAYARYRIMMLFLIQGWDSDARVVYDTLQSKYPEGEPGSIFSKLAVTFWDEYHTSGSLGVACQVVVEEAGKDPAGVLKYFGVNGNLGMGINYKVKDICPFE